MGLAAVQGKLIYMWATIVSRGEFRLKMLLKASFSSSRITGNGKNHRMPKKLRRVTSIHLHMPCKHVCSRPSVREGLRSCLAKLSSMLGGCCFQSHGSVTIKILPEGIRSLLGAKSG